MRVSDRIVELVETGCDDSVQLAFQTFMPQEWKGCDAGDASAKRPAQESF